MEESVFFLLFLLDDRNIRIIRIRNIVRFNLVLFGTVHCKFRTVLLMSIIEATFDNIL
jgi:hypothetical protein